MKFKAALSVLLPLVLLQVLLGSVVVESGSGSILSSFFRSAGRDAAKEVGEVAAEDAIQAVASGVNDPNHPYQQPQYNGEGGSSTGGLTAAQLDYLQSVVKGILASPVLYQQHYCGVGFYQNPTSPVCRFVTCCITDGRGDPYGTNARAIGQDCFLQLIVQDILAYPTFQQQYCGGGATNPDCGFVKCTINANTNPGYTSPKSIGQSCYRTSYYPSSGSRSESSSIFTAAVLVAVSLAVMGTP